MRIGTHEKREMKKGIFDPDWRAPSPIKPELRTPCAECNGGRLCALHYVRAVLILAGFENGKIGPYKKDERYAALYTRVDDCDD